MKKFKHVRVQSKRYPNDWSIFKLTRDDRYFKIQGSSLDSKWYYPEKIFAELIDTGDEIIIKFPNKTLVLEHFEIEELGLLIKYFEQHSNCRNIRKTVRSKK